MRLSLLILGAALAGPAVAAPVCSPPSDLKPAPVLAPPADEVVAGVTTAILPAVR